MEIVPCGLPFISKFCTAQFPHFTAFGGGLIIAVHIRLDLFLENSE
jgi:hypothetical protein